MKRSKIVLFLQLFFFSLLSTILSPFWMGVEKFAMAEEVTFDIHDFYIEGNTIYSDSQLEKVVNPFKGTQKTVGDVEQARTAVEKYYHENGYPTALVNIPEQTIEDGTVSLAVIESKVRRVTTKGNRYFTRERLLKELPAFRPGEILYLPEVKKQLARVNRNPDMKVAPILMPGKKLGTVDVEFRVKDKLPLHGSLELNNRSTHTTTDLRLNAMLRYDNLWQKEHSIVMQYQTTPEDLDEVKMIIGSYALPSPWNDDHLITAYGLMSDSDTATVEGITVIGKGYIVGARYMAALPSVESYLHDLVFGIDYKKFEEDIEGEDTTVDYLPFHMGYTGRYPDKYGQTAFNIGLNVALRSLGSEDEDFEQKRSLAQGNYSYLTAGIERQHKLFWGWHLLGKARGQISSHALIPNEQFIAGGIDSVRGYKESEASGDKGVNYRLELIAPDLATAMKVGSYLELRPYLFFDGASLSVNDPLEGEDRTTDLRGWGTGMRGYLAKYIGYELDWATALDDTIYTEEGDWLIHFKVFFKF